MLTAVDQDGYNIAAWEAEREQAPFYCPECDGVVILKQGREKVDHFAHKQQEGCSYGTGESEAHREAKYEIYTALQQNRKVSNVALEKSFGSVRPDVSFTFGRLAVAVEVQLSVLSMDELIRRTSVYAEQGMYVLWTPPISDKLLLSSAREEAYWRPYEYRYQSIRYFWAAPDDELHYCFLHDSLSKQYAPRQWEKFLHALYFGRVYYWLEGETLLPVHFGSCSYRFRVPKAEKRTLISSLAPMSRDAWEGSIYDLPKCKLWAAPHRPAQQGNRSA